MEETDGAASPRDAAQLLRVAEDEAAKDHVRAAAARELAGLQGHQEEGVELLTALATARGDGGRSRQWPVWLIWPFQRRRHSPGSDGWLRLLASQALIDLPAQRDIGVAMLAELAADQDASAFTREAAAQRLAGVEGRSEQAAALLLGIATDRKTSHTIRAGSAQRLARIPGHEAAGIGILTEFVADPALSDKDRLYAARCSKDIGHGEAGVTLLSQLIDDPAFDAGERVEAVVLLASIEGQADAGAAVLRAFADQDGFPSLARVRAASALFDVPGHEPAAVEMLAQLADDVRLGHGEDYERPSRAEAADLLARLPGQLDAGAGRLLRIAQDTDGTVGVNHRIKAARALSRHEKYRATGTDLLARMARDRGLSADERTDAANSLSYLEGHEREALTILESIASRSTEPFDHARSLAHHLRKRLEESPDAPRAD